MTHATTTFDTRLSDVTVRLGTPRVIDEGVGFCWYPDVRAFPTGELLFTHVLHADDDANLIRGQAVFISHDRGEHWDPSYQTPEGPAIRIPLPGGSIGGPGSYLYPEPRGQSRRFVTDYHTLLDGGRRYLLEPRAVHVEGLPRDIQPYLVGHPNREQMALIFLTGDAIDLGGEFVTTAYLQYVGETRYTNVALSSTDKGRDWQYVGTVAGPEDAPEADEGPCEATTVQLADGDLMCVMRTSGRKTALCRAYSADGGRTWSDVDRLPAWGVLPSLRRLADGTLVLSTGRPGLQLWISTDPRGRSWEMIDLLAHHNGVLSSSHHIGPSTAPAKEPEEQTTAYTVLLEVAPSQLLLVYDRSPFGWNPVPLDSDERSRIYLLPIEVGRA